MLTGPRTPIALSEPNRSTTDTAPKALDANAPGRTCPVRYRYDPAVIAAVPERDATTLYVVGGVYGNPFALDALDAMLGAESESVTVCFNGDFNWFNVDGHGFAEINRRVLSHDAVLGNVEAEMVSGDASVGCGCGYPEDVDDDVVERSNRIHARLQATAASHQEVLQALGKLSMYARYRVGDLGIAVIHGDLCSLAGWDFDFANLRRLDRIDELQALFLRAAVDVAACSHTCLPVMRNLGPVGELSASVVANNGAAGLPNFRGTRYGVITRISIEPSPHPTLYGLDIGGVLIDALPLVYDHAAWVERFLALWPVGSDAHRSYFERICEGPDHLPKFAAP